MSSREPSWFRAEPFYREVLHFSFRQFGLLSSEIEERLLHYPEEFREAVRTVGRGVFTLQVIIRGGLIPFFIESINVIADVIHEGIYIDFLFFLCQGYLNKDIFNFTLSSMAVVAELIIFLNAFELPLPTYFYPLPWCAIYEHRLRHELEANGGWERLLDEVKLKYIDSNFFQETSLSFINNNVNPYAERPDRYNWPEDPAAFLIERFGVIPRNTTLAMRILRELYKHEQLTPVPGAGAYAVRRMLHIERPEDDWHKRLQWIWGPHVYVVELSLTTLRESEFILDCCGIKDYNGSGDLMSMSLTALHESEFTPDCCSIKDYNGSGDLMFMSLSCWCSFLKMNKSMQPLIEISVKSITPPLQTVNFHSQMQDYFEFQSFLLGNPAVGPRRMDTLTNNAPLTLSTPSSPSVDDLLKRRKHNWKQGEVVTKNVDFNVLKNEIWDSANMLLESARELRKTTEGNRPSYAAVLKSMPTAITKGPVANPCESNDVLLRQKKESTSEENKRKLVNVLIKINSAARITRIAKVSLGSFVIEDPSDADLQALEAELSCLENIKELLKFQSRKGDGHRLSYLI
ncbi:hypothetical protein HNY73_016375 [Argiope bruennichi]|uniref:Uncharacterized protein n=1 Tax=Argiope bruennichi TaxID=94029 RepID=A0A8T0EIL8_ARGBR|nr:hypothetical protein HNY73_016375 [Argiope bruennichi]